MAPGSPHSEPQRMPSFFKVMACDFKRRVKIPTEFIKQMRRKRPSKSILRGSNGKTWQVGVKESQDEFYFQKGWSEFVKDNSLEKGEFVVFHGHDNFNFDVIFLGNDHCEKGAKDETKLPSKVKNKHTKEPPPFLCKCKYFPVDENGGLAFDAGSCAYKLSNPHFVSVMKRGRNMATLRISNTFGRESGLWPGFGDRTCLRDPSGRSWLVSVTLQDKRSGRGGFGKEWKNMVKTNELVSGDVCIFEVIKKGNSKNPSLFSLHIHREGRWR